MTDERDADDLDKEVADLEASAGKVQDDIEETRSDWEHKKDDPAVPGAVPDPEDSESEAGEPDSD